MARRPRREREKISLAEEQASLYSEEEATKDTLRCFSTKNCGAGFACIGGFCVKENKSSTQTCQDQKNCQPTTSVNPATGCTEDDCDCCNKGTRTVRLYGGLVATTKCTSIDTERRSCDPFMNSYNELFGRLPFGLTESTVGEATEGQICDECSECEGSDLKCVPKTEGPCWCEQLSCSERCKRCDNDGICRTDCRNCIRKYYGTCCGKRVSVISNACLGSRAKANAKIQADCGECPDCTPKVEYKTHCDGAPPPCPSGATCTTTGIIEAGGRTCLLITETYDSDLPPECDLCNDVICEKCEKCNSETGACEPDPECNCRWVIDQGKSFRTHGDRTGRLSLNTDAPNNKGLSLTMEEISDGWSLVMTPSYWEPTESCTPEGDCVVTSLRPSPTSCSGTGGGCSLEKVSPNGEAIAMIYSGFNECDRRTAYDLNGDAYRVDQVSGCSLTVGWNFVCD